MDNTSAKHRMMERVLKSGDEITHELVRENSTAAPCFETRLGAIVGGVDALWHVMRRLEDDHVPGRSLEFIHAALEENVRALSAGLHAQGSHSVWSLPCPTVYREEWERLLTVDGSEGANNADERH